MFCKHFNLTFSNAVRLGEFDTSTDGLDCVDVEGGGSDCNEGTITIPIEEIIVHPEYERGHNSSKLNVKHNIALIRLKESAPFTGRYYGY